MSILCGYQYEHLNSNEARIIIISHFFVCVVVFFLLMHAGDILRLFDFDVNSSDNDKR